MRMILALLISSTIWACQKKASLDTVAPDASATTAGEWRENLMAFSEAVGRGKGNAIPSPEQETDIPSQVAPSPLPQRHRRDTPGRPKVARLPNPALSVTLQEDSSDSRRPFSREEIAEFIRVRYLKAKTLLALKDPAGLNLIEEAQVYTQDGTFALMRAEWAFLHGDAEGTLVQAELAMGRIFVLDMEGPKKASLLRCKALEAIRDAKPSDPATIRAARARLHYNLTFSP